MAKDVTHNSYGFPPPHEALEDMLLLTLVTLVMPPWLNSQETKKLRSLSYINPPLVLSL